MKSFVAGNASMGGGRVAWPSTSLIAACAFVVGALAAIASVGSPAVAEPLGPDETETPDSTGRVGRFTSLALDGAGNPVISYRDGTNGDLRVLHCTNPDCSGTQTPQSPDTTGTVGLFTSLVLDSSGNPVISYYDQTNGDLRLLHCTNPDCSGPQAPQSPDTIGDVGRFTSLALDGAGNPVISYYDAVNGDLRLMHCTNPDCSGTQSGRIPDSLDNVGRSTSLVLDAAGNPVISYYDVTNGDLRVLHCTNPTCSLPQSPQSPDTAGDVGQHTSLALDAAGNPVISYFDDTNGDLRVLHCTNPDCSGSQNAQSPDRTGRVGLYSSLVLDSAGNPVISYQDDTNGNLRVLHCTNPNCSGTQRPHTLNTTAFDGADSSLALDSAGNPVVSFEDEDNGDLRLLHCYNPAGCGGQDQDRDNVTHSDDNCPGTANADQDDKDDDGRGDACDTRDNRIPKACADFEGANVIIGTANGETLRGTPGSDVIIGLGGNDTLIGRGGNDCIRGGSGADTIRGGSGADTLFGQKGRDTIEGGKGGDTISGGSKGDLIKGNGGADTIRGNKGDDQIRGGKGRDTLRGNGGNDDIRGGGGTDTCKGGSGADQLRSCNEA